MTISKTEQVEILVDGIPQLIELEWSGIASEGKRTGPPESCYPAELDVTEQRAWWVVGGGHLVPFTESDYRLFAEEFVRAVDQSVYNYAA